MKNKVISITAVIILLCLFIMGVYNELSWFNLQNKIDKTNQESEDRSKLQNEYNSTIREIYEIANSNLDSSLHKIEKSRKEFPDGSNDLDYVEARILLINNQKEKATKLINKIRQNSKSESPRFSEIYAYLQIENGKFDLAEKHLLNAAQINKDYKFQLANFYEIKTDTKKAIELYSELISNNSASKNKAAKRKEIIENQISDGLKNIELRDDSERVHFSIGKLNIR